MRTVSWGELLADAVDRLRKADVESPETNARWIGEEASGTERAAFVLSLDAPAPRLAAARFEAMVGRRLTGEPLQYVLGRWAFRTFDLMLDRRVLIPRPETEQVVEHALAEIDRLTGDFGAGQRSGEPSSNGRRQVNVVDLGCGSGAIGLSIAAERGTVAVWCVDASQDAITVTRQNLANLHLRCSTVTVIRGSWFEALPPDLAGAVDLIVANPPYVAADDELPAEVVDWEPADALVAGASGLEAIEHIVEHAPGWLTANGVLVIEIGETQAARAGQAARRAGFGEVEVRQDLAGRDRMLLARRPR